MIDIRVVGHGLEKEVGDDQEEEEAGEDAQAPGVSDGASNGSALGGNGAFGDAAGDVGRQDECEECEDAHGEGVGQKAAGEEDAGEHGGEKHLKKGNPRIEDADLVCAKIEWVNRLAALGAGDGFVGIGAQACEVVGAVGAAERSWSGGVLWHGLDCQIEKTCDPKIQQCEQEGGHYVEEGPEWDKPSLELSWIDFGRDECVGCRDKKARKSNN